MTRFKTLSSIAAIIAALSMAALPVAAADLPVAPAGNAPTGFSVFEADSENADRHRRYRGRHDRGVDAGDVIAGVLILGGIAAIASAASEPRREARSYPSTQSSYPSRRSNSGQGLDRAVNMCLQEIERDVRVESVDGVDRTGSGWNVTGQLYDGEGFSCQIGNDGRVSNISYGGQRVSYTEGGSDYQGADRQYSADRYAEMRRQADAQGSLPSAASSAATSDGQPAYPGGPVNGQYYDDDGYGG